MLMAGLATSAMGIAALQDRLSGTGLPEGAPSLSYFLTSCAFVCVFG
nr:MAG TPA: hypothetical protein [Caudoviricetes sp.]